MKKITIKTLIICVILILPGCFNLKITDQLADKQITFEEQQINKETENMIIEVKYPKTSNDFINEVIDEFIKEQIADFKADYSSKEIYNNVKYSLNVFYENYLTTERIVSIKFVVSHYTGGVHGDALVYTKNFDLEKEQLITLDRLIPDMQDELIEYVRGELRKSEWYSDWTDAGVTKQALENFTFDEKSVIFHFSPYEVAPYAAGIVEVPIEYNKIKYMMDEEYYEILYLENK